MSFLHHIFAFDSNSPLLFTQFYFWAFFAIVYSVFALIVRKQTSARLHLRNVFLLFVSWFFYYKTSGLFLLILAFVTLSDWLIAKGIYQSIGRQRLSAAKALLVLSVVIDLGLLAYFKYAYFFTNMVNDLFGCSFEVFDIFAYIGNGFRTTGRFDVESIVLPVGISFYIFQVISYTADVYRGKIKPVRNLLDFGFYAYFWRIDLLHRVLFNQVLLFRIAEDQTEAVVMVLDGLLRQGLAIRLAVFAPQPSEVLGNSNACDLIARGVIELGEDNLQDVGIHGDCGGTMGAIPHTEREPYFIDKGIKCVSVGGTHHGCFFLFFEVGFRYEK